MKKRRMHDLEGNIHVNLTGLLFSAQHWPAQPSLQAAHLLVRSAISSHRSNMRMMDALATEVFSVVSSSIELRSRLTLSVSFPLLWSLLQLSYHLPSLATMSFSKTFCLLITASPNFFLSLSLFLYLFCLSGLGAWGKLWAGPGWVRSI